MRTFCAYQSTQYSCGYAAVKTMAANLNQKESLLYFPEGDCSEPAPLSLIMDYGAKLGLKLLPLKVDPKELPLNKEFPLLLLLSQNGVSHMAVLQKEKGPFFLILDPSSGPRWVRKKELAKSFSGIYCALESFVPNPGLKTKAPRKEKEYTFALLSLFLCFSFSCIAGSLSSSGLNKWWSFLFFGISLLFLGVYLVFFFLCLKRFDERYMGLFAKTQDKRKERYETYENYRALYLGAPSRAIASFGFGLALLSGFAFMDIRLGFTLLIGLSFLLISRLTDVKEGKAILEKVNKEEKDFLTSSKETMPKLQLLHRDSALLGCYWILRKACFVLLSLGISALSLSLQGRFSEANLFSYGFALSTFLFALDKGLDDLELRKAKKKAEFLFYYRFGIYLTQ